MLSKTSKNNSISCYGFRRPSPAWPSHRDGRTAIFRPPQQSSTLRWAEILPRIWAIKEGLYCMEGGPRYQHEGASRSCCLSSGPRKQGHIQDTNYPLLLPAGPNVVDLVLSLSRKGGSQALGEPRIWADFIRDEVLMDEPHNPMLNRIRCWEFAAKEDVKKIRALGIGIRRDSMPNHATT